MTADVQENIADIEDLGALCAIYDKWQGKPADKYTPKEQFVIMRALYKNQRYRDCLNLYRSCRSAYPAYGNLNNYMGWSVYRVYFVPLKEAKFQAREWQKQCDRLCRQAGYVLKNVEGGQYSPVWKIVDNLTEALMKGRITPAADYARALYWLKMLDPAQLDTAEISYVDQDGKARSLASPREVWYSRAVKCLFQLKEYEECIRLGEQLWTHPFTNKFHNNRDCWIKYCMSKSYIALGKLPEAAEIARKVVSSFPNWNFYGLLCEVAMQQDNMENFQKYAGCTALADKSHQMRIKIYAQMADFLHQHGQIREALLHRKLVANLYAENNWSQKKGKTLEFPHDIAGMSTKDVLKELKILWQQWQDAGKEFHEGTIERILPNGGSGFIRAENGESHYFNFRDAKCKQALLQPGSRVKFVLIDRMDKKKNQMKKNAIDIRSL